MRIVATALVLFMVAGPAIAQTGSISAQGAGRSADAPKAETEPAGNGLRTSKSAVDDAKAECIRMWDAGTHMSKREWEVTCGRVQNRLDNLKVENLDVMGTGVRKKSGGKQGNLEAPDRRTN